MNLPDDLQAGDILLYDTPPVTAADLSLSEIEGRVSDAVIDLKEGGDVAHIEVYHGAGFSVASRNGLGVNLYPYRASGLKYVRRPMLFFMVESADLWFNNGIKGLPYGWAGLLEFENIDVPSRGLICSTLADLYLIRGGAPMFAPDFPPGKVSPFDFRKTAWATTLSPAPNV